MKEQIKEEILQRFLNTDSGGSGGRNGLTQREKILLHIATDVAFKNLAYPHVSKPLQKEKIVTCNKCGKTYNQSDDFSSINGVPTCRTCISTFTWEE